MPKYGGYPCTCGPSLPGTTPPAHGCLANHGKGAAELLREWCDQHLDTSNFDGMVGAKQRVEDAAAELGLEVNVRWDQVPSWHPTLRCFEGAGTHPCLVIEEASESRKGSDYD